MFSLETTNSSASETITQPTQINITTSFNEPSCFGFSDGAISLNVSGASLCFFA